jgi:hypothetical protein
MIYAYGVATLFVSDRWGGQAALAFVAGCTLLGGLLGVVVVPLAIRRDSKNREARKRANVRSWIEEHGREPEPHERGQAEYWDIFRPTFTYKDANE